jgi:hypothetical protein
MKDINPIEVEKAIDWIYANAEMRKRINKRYSSYGLKHIAERWAKEYISNDSFIEAMIRCGYNIQRCSPTSPNYWFNIKTLKVKA